MFNPSSWRTVWYRVPQGLVLGLVLFLILINDFDFIIISWILIFADDTKLFSKEGSLSKLQKGLEKLFTSFTVAMADGIQYEQMHGHVYGQI